MVKVRHLIQSALRHLDRHVLEAWYVALSAPSERFRAQLRRARKPFLDPRQASTPSAAELDHTADWVIHQAAFGASALGGMAGLGGAASVPPEVLARVVAVLRLGQRLAVVYGFDPETDRGKMVLWQTIAAGYEVQLPEQGPVGLRMSELPAIVAPRVSPRSVGGSLTRAMVRASAWRVTGRWLRFIPVLSAATSAADGARHIQEVGRRMREALKRVAELPALEGAPLEEAKEVAG